MRALEPSRRSPPTWRVLAVLAVITALAPLSMDIFTPSLPVLQTDLGTDEWVAQASITACLLGIGVGQLVWGPLSDRVGRRPVILSGVAGWTLASAASAAATSAAVLVGARGAAGLAGAAGIVAARSVVRDLSDDSVAVASRIGLLSLVTAVAPVVAPVAGTAIAAAWGWRGDFVVLTVLGGVLLVAFARTVPETAPLARRASSHVLHDVRVGLGKALRDRELRLVGTVIGAWSAGFYAYVASASFVVERELGHPPAVFALVFGSNAVAMLGANLLFRRLVRRRHPAGPVGLGLALGTLGGLALALAGRAGAPPAVLWMASAAVATSAGFVLPGCHAWGQLTVVASGAASALTGSAQFLGGVLGSPATGLLGSTAARLGGVVALGSGLGLVVWVAATRHRSIEIGASSPTGARKRQG